MLKLADLFGFLARSTAFLGGLVLLVLVALVCVSVTGRGLNTLAHSDAFSAFAPQLAAWILERGVGSVNGDFELLEAGIAVVIFAALPLCQFVGGHATVDVFTRFLPPIVQRYLKAFWEVVLAAVIVLIGMRLWEGLLSKMSNGQTTFILEFPVWWAYAVSFAACAIAMVVSVFCALVRVLDLFTGQRTLPVAEDAMH